MATAANVRRFTYLRCALSAYRVRSRGAFQRQCVRNSYCAFYFNSALCVQLSGKLKIVICDHDARNSIVIWAVCARHEMCGLSIDADTRGIKCAVQALTRTRAPAAHCQSCHKYHLFWKYPTAHCGGGADSMLTFNKMSSRNIYQTRLLLNCSVLAVFGCALRVFVVAY